MNYFVSSYIVLIEMYCCERATQNSRQKKKKTRKVKEAKEWKDKMSVLCVLTFVSRNQYSLFIRNTQQSTKFSEQYD